MYVYVCMYVCVYVCVSKDVMLFEIPYSSCGLRWVYIYICACTCKAEEGFMILDIHSHCCVFFFL